MQHLVYFDELAQAALLQSLENKGYSKVFVLVDTNTRTHCLPILKNMIKAVDSSVIEIKAGEEHKNLDSCKAVWDTLSTEGGDRQSLLINLGGGVVTDLGGFVASTFKRGIDFINVPTTLLAMVDAAIGGKTGVDFQSLKNQIGVINQPELIAVFPEFLNTLEKRQIKSGFAEMLKHGLISDFDYWQELKALKNLDTIGDKIQKSVEIKSHVVHEDVDEKGLRKILNFGHTLGHAIESHFLIAQDKSVLLHGEAIAVGMVLEAYLSHKLSGLSKIELDEIKRAIDHIYPKVQFNNEDITSCIDLLKHDKKNTHGDVNFVLLKTIGKAVIDIKVPSSLFEEAFQYYSLP
ncbi:3-dehydroquinate synthase [Allomuricauda sp. d1]|uniref:3-dehydroquinate synthase n=1 Tax=Allomuricauda sp. d1 TaxID=3136725 RepID=UPI0031D6ECDE